MNKPVKKKRIGISEISNDFFFYFNAIEKYAEMLPEFGVLIQHENFDSWQLRIDARYNPQDIFNYINAINNEK